MLKGARGKLPLPEGSLGEAVETQGFPVLAISARHVEATPRFEGSLQDPFDRLLIATAFEEGMLLMTQDCAILDLSRRVKLPVAEIQ